MLILTQENYHSIAANLDYMSRSQYVGFVYECEAKEMAKLADIWVAACNSVHATSALIELGFHDNALEAEWMTQSTAGIAEAIYRGICDYYGYDYRSLAGVVPVIVPAEDRDIYLSVRVLQSKAEGLVKQIQAMGYACQVLPLA